MFSGEAMITVVADHFPIAMIDMGSSPRTDADFQTLFSAFDAVARRAEREETRYVILATTQDTMTAGERLMLATHANRLSRRTMGLCIAGVCVLPRQTALLRGVLIALSWLIPIVPPLSAVSSVEEGLEQVESLLRKHRIRCSTESVAACSRWMRDHAGARATSSTISGRGS
jgi:hypothetical protein